MAADLGIDVVKRAAFNGCKRDFSKTEGRVGENVNGEVVSHSTGHYPSRSIGADSSVGRAQD